MRLMRKSPQKMKNRQTTHFADDAKKKTVEKRHEAQIGSMRGKPRMRCAACCTMKARPSGRLCRRSPRRMRCWEPCGGTRGTKPSSSKAALRCTASAGSLGHSPAPCSGTPPSTPRCTPRPSMSAESGARRSSVCGCSRRASSGGTVLEGEDSRTKWQPKSCKGSHCLQRVTSQIWFKFLQ